MPSAAPQTKPTVSLCIPTYQGARYLPATLNAALSQSFEDLEIVVLDNNSSDGTREILDAVSDPRVRIERNTETLPMAENWNRLLGHCRGTLIKLLCADDLISPDCVAEQAEILLADPEVAVTACMIDLVDAAGQPLRRSVGLRGLRGRRTGIDVARRMVRSGGNPVGPPAAVMFRRADSEAVGGFNPHTNYGDIDLWIRLLRYGDFVGTPFVGATFRVSSSSVSGLMSARSGLAQQQQLAQLVSADPHWRVTLADRALGYWNLVTMQARRSLLFARAAARDRSRGWGSAAS